MFDLIPEPIRNFIDAPFAPLLTFLGLMRDMLNQASLVAGKGINVNNYFSFFAYMPPEWQNVVKSAMTSIMLLAILFIVRSIWDMFFRVKDSGKVLL